MSAANDARAAILARIRAARGADGHEEPRRRAVRARLGGHPPGVAVAAAELDAAGRLALFRAKALYAAATITEVARAEDLPRAIAQTLAERNLPPALRHGADPRLAALPWERVPLLARSTGRSFGDDRVGLSWADAGVAETGTLVLTSGSDNPTTLNFLPELHLVVLEAANVAAVLEHAFRTLRTRFGAGEMPRTVNLVTGPSRSADIEQTLLYGAHGPKALAILLVGGGEGSGEGSAEPA